MPKPKREQVCLDITQNYHIVARCVRRQFLCGSFGNQNYEHRKEWIESKLADLVTIFAVQLYGYAIMSNHYHLVVHVNPQQAQQWSDREVVQRWREVFTSDVLAKRYADGGNLDDSEWAVLKKRIEVWRERLSDISWFMRVLNEFIARAANKEERAQAFECDHHDNAKETTSPSLLELSDDPSSELPITPQSYLALLDYSGRLIKADKAGYIRSNQPTILDQLKVSERQWRVLCKDFESPFKQFVGTCHEIKQACQQLGKSSLHGLGAASRLFA